MSDSDNSFGHSEHTTGVVNTTKLAAAIAAVLASAGVSASQLPKTNIQIDTIHLGLKTVMDEVLTTQHDVGDSNFVLAWNFENYAKNFENYAKNFENYAKNFENYGRFYENPRLLRDPESHRHVTTSPPPQLPNGRPIPSSIQSLRRST